MAIKTWVKEKTMKEDKTSTKTKEKQTVKRRLSEEWNKTDGPDAS